MNNPCRQLGASVRICKTSGYYGQHDGVGTVIILRNESGLGLDVRVGWPDGYYNAYSSTYDLELVEPKTVPNRRRGSRKETV